MIILGILQLICILGLFSLSVIGAVNAKRYRHQRNCLYKYFNTYSERYFLYERLPDDLVEVLSEIEKEGSNAFRS